MKMLLYQFLNVPDRTTNCMYIFRNVHNYMFLDTIILTLNSNMNTLIITEFRK